LSPGSDKPLHHPRTLAKWRILTPKESQNVTSNNTGRVVSDCPKPLIAAVGGYALVGGLDLARSLTLSARGGARLGPAELKLGIVYPGGRASHSGLAQSSSGSTPMLLLITAACSFTQLEALAMCVVTR